MGHKGVSKRKPSQIKSKPSAVSTGVNSVSSVIQATENQPVKTFDTGKGGTAKKGNEKHSSNRK